MPIEETYTVTCDNPDCPGNALDPANRAGWMYVTAQLFGEVGTYPFVYCSADCVAAVGDALTARLAEE